MKKLLYFLMAAGLPIGIFAQDNYTHEFETYSDDPYKVLHYTLKNGLEIYLSVNKDEPRVSTNIAVRTGSKNDPSDVTGLAHYLEHMLFKGTSKIGSLNWEEEKKYLKQISDLYERYRMLSDTEERKQIYSEIDALSLKASEFVATNEYDQMIKSLGARGTNAYTSLERTVYINDIPSNEMEKWMMIESERFQELVLRLFHTELEAVYEEFNRGLDSDGRQANAKMMEALFPTHTYGTQTTIGKGEHLKNPSMEKIHEYFNTYYVPNNTAIVMVGDLDPDRTVDLIEKYFGSWQKGPRAPQFEDPGEKPIAEPIKREVNGSEAAFVDIAYRFDGIESGDDIMADLVAEILSNGKAGLIDQNLNQQQKVLRAYAYSQPLKDYTLLNLGATPRKGQTLEEAEELLMQQIGLLRSGQFDKGLITSIVKNAKRTQMNQAESNGWKSYLILNKFIYEIPWDYYTQYYNKMGKISKDELVAWAKKNLTGNYVTVYKREGERDPLRIEKPEITAVTVNRGKPSKFRQQFDEMESSRIQPEFVNYEEQIVANKLKSGIPYYHITNTTNGLFRLNYIFDMGSRNDRQLALAIRYLPYLGTAKYSVEDIKRKFYDLALDYSVNAGNHRLYVTLSGLDESMEEGIQLFEELLAEVAADPEAYSKMVEGIIKRREDGKLSKNRILYGGMWNYALYGENSPFVDIYSETELKAMDPEALVSKLQDLKGYKHKVFYYGPSSQEEVMAMVDRYHRIGDEFSDYPAKKEYQLVDHESPIVYFVDYDQVQVEILMLSKGETFNKDVMGAANVFNQYFGSGLSSIVFQEIRESKALAYSAYSVYTTPSRGEDHHYVRAYIGTQGDKLSDAINAMQVLMNDMPKVETSFEEARTGALKQMETNRTTKSSVFWSYQGALDRGLTTNPQPEVYQAIKNLEFENLETFFQNYIKGKQFVYLVIGNKENLNMEALENLGEIKELELAQIFGY